MLGDLQASFSAAVLDNAVSVPANLRSLGPGGSTRRFAVHRSNVVFGLIEALRSRFRVAVRIVGDEFFNEMARRFVLAHPPTSAVLLRYGDDLAEFAAALPEVEAVPYLPDMLRLEAAFTQAYHGADVEPATAQDLATLPVDAPGEAVVELHPTLRLIRSAYPIVTIWVMNQDGAEPRSIEDACGEDALIVRPRLAVDLMRLPEGGFEFLDGLRAGLRIGPAVEATLEAAPRFDIAAALAGLVSAGVAVRFVV